RTRNYPMSYPIQYPPPLIQKTLRLEAAGDGPPATLMLVLPSIVRPGELVGLNVSVLDERGLPLADGGAAPVTVHVPDGNGGTVAQTVDFPAGEPAVCRIEGIAFNQPGFVRIAAACGELTAHSNPALVSTEERPQILWGDPHIHTMLSDCHPERCRSRVLAYAAARYVYGLDFAAIADHVSGGKRGTFGKWRDNLAMADLFNDAPEFATLLCYEASMPSGEGGDNNVYLAEPREHYVDPGEEKLTVRELAEKLDPGDYLVPHHTSRANKHGEIPPELYPGEARMPVVEIHSKWGCSEYPGHPDGLNKPRQGPAYAQDLLASGYHIGFIGGTDTHTSLTFGSALEPDHIRHRPGLTAALAADNHRRAIHNAIANRQCYAACGERIVLDVTCDELNMGEVKSASGDPKRSRTIAVRCAAQSSIDTLEIIRNGQVVHTVAAGDWQTACTWTDSEALDAVAMPHSLKSGAFVYYYVRVTTASGARAWSSPCWFECGK
ncbi:MAG: hypothetical protein ACOCWJ_03830, partial [Verrucomicrobiota bacterium]